MYFSLFNNTSLSTRILLSQTFKSESSMHHKGKQTAIRALLSTTTFYILEQEKNYFVRMQVSLHPMPVVNESFLRIHSSTHIQLTHYAKITGQ